MIFRPNECFIISQNANTYGIIFFDFHHIKYYECDDDMCSNCRSIYSFNTNEGQIECGPNVYINRYDYIIEKKMLDNELISKKYIDTYCHDGYKYQCFGDDNKYILAEIVYCQSI